MRIALINGSPKANNSSSGRMLKDLKDYLADRAQTVEAALRTDSIPEEVWRKLEQSRVWVFSCPLYIDGIPSHLLSCLMQLEKARAQNPEIHEAPEGKGIPKSQKVFVYAMVNCGFYEGTQAEHALALMRNWCVKAGQSWGGGIGIGGGGALAMMPDTPPGKGPKGPIDAAVGRLADRILNKEAGENCYVSAAFPRFLYKLCGQMGWRQMIKANGGRRKDLGKRMEVTKTGGETA